MHAPDPASIDPTGPPLATVVIPSYNAERLLSEALAALDAQRLRGRFDTLVVDNGSTDGSLDVARDLADRVILVEERGSGPCRTEGLRRVRGPFMLSLDADCVPIDDRWAERHLAALLTAPSDVIASCGRLVPRPTDDRWAARADITPHPAVGADGTPLYAVTGNACFRAEEARALGGFPALGADDASFGEQARAAGLRFVATPEAAVYHTNPAGWRGYASQMRKIGRYGAEMAGRPASPARYYLGRLRYARSAGAHLLHGRWHDAAATALAAVAQVPGAREAWRANPDGFRPVAARPLSAIQEPVDA